MKRVDSVISLIYSLSKSEKKHFSLQVVKDKEEKDYLVIYDIITKSKQPNGNTVKETGRHAAHIKEEERHLL